MGIYTHNFIVLQMPRPLSTASLSYSSCVEYTLKVLNECVCYGEVSLSAREFWVEWSAVLRGSLIDLSIVFQ